MLDASFFDKDNDGIDVVDVSILLGVAIVVWGAARAALRRLGILRKSAMTRIDEHFIVLAKQVGELDAKVEERTAPIQKEANGGYSLPDAINEIHGLKERQESLENKFDDLIGILLTEKADRLRGAIHTRTTDEEQP